ncbi:MAG: leucine-rich repeat domain-containing protein [Chthoniobacter sp.]
MKIPSRLLPSLLVGFTCLLTASAARAAEEKVDAGPPSTAEETKAVAELAGRGVRADQVANGVNWRYVNFRGAEKPDAALYALLKSVPSIVELNLAGMQFTPADLANIGALKNLATLNLSGTNVTDDGLAAVESLEKLQSLNLFSTGITDAGLGHLSHLKNLHRLYLAETKVTDAGVETLKKTLPEVKINRGATLAPPVAAAAPAPKPDEKPAAPPAKPVEEKPATPPAKPEEKKADAPAPPKPPEEKPAPPAPKSEEKKPDPAAAPAK